MDAFYWRIAKDNHRIVMVQMLLECAMSFKYKRTKFIHEKASKTTGKCKRTHMSTNTPELPPERFERECKGHLQCLSTRRSSYKYCSYLLLHHKADNPNLMVLPPVDVFQVQCALVFHPFWCLSCQRWQQQHQHIHRGGDSIIFDQILVCVQVVQIYTKCNMRQSTKKRRLK